MANALTQALLDQEINQFMLAHFREHITSDNLKDLELIWEKFINGESSEIYEEHQELITQLNVTEEAQQDF
jgi:hypothetical protein